VAEDAIEKGKKKRSRSGTRMRVRHTVTYENLNKPSHPEQPIPSAADDALDECAAPDAVKATGNPWSGHPGARSPVDRVSPPLTAGHQAPSTGDHGAGADPMNVPGPREMAWNHPDLRQGSTTVNPLVSLSTRHEDRPDASIIWGSGRVSVDQLHTSDVAEFTSMPSGNPAVRGYSPHMARNSATPPNGSHSLSNPGSHAAPMATKGSDTLRIMRQNQRRV
jgi:hypothetical protein